MKSLTKSCLAVAIASFVCTTSAFAQETEAPACRTVDELLSEVTGLCCPQLVEGSTKKVSYMKAKQCFEDVAKVAKSASVLLPEGKNSVSAVRKAINVLLKQCKAATPPGDRGNGNGNDKGGSGGGSGNTGGGSGSTGGGSGSNGGSGSSGGGSGVSCAQCMSQCLADPRSGGSQDVCKKVCTDGFPAAGVPAGLCP
jgi:hypothetical protein